MSCSLEHDEIHRPQYVFFASPAFWGSRITPRMSNHLVGMDSLSRGWVQRNEILTSVARRRYLSRIREPSAFDSPHAAAEPWRLRENKWSSIARP